MEGPGDFLLASATSLGLPEIGYLLLQSVSSVDWGVSQSILKVSFPDVVFIFGKKNPKK